MGTDEQVASVRIGGQLGWVVVIRSTSLGDIDIPGCLAGHAESQFS